MPAPRPTNPHSLIIPSGHNLIASWGVVDVHDGTDMVLDDIDGCLHLAHVKDVAVVVLVGHCKVKGLHGVEAEGVGAHGEHGLVDRGIGADVMQHHRPN